MDKVVYLIHYVTRDGDVSFAKIYDLDFFENVYETFCRDFLSGKISSLTFSKLTVDEIV